MFNPSIEAREKRRRGGVGQIQVTYDVRADLTTEDGVLGDHVVEVSEKDGEVS